MKRYLKIGIISLALIGAGFLLGTGAIGDLINIGESKIAAGSARADTEEYEAETAQTAAEIERSYNEGVQGNLRTGTEILKGNFLESIRLTVDYANESAEWDDFDSSTSACLLSAAGEAFDKARRASEWSPSNNGAQAQDAFVEALQAETSKIPPRCDLNDNQRQALRRTVFNEEGEADSFVELNFTARRDGTRR